MSASSDQPPIVPWIDRLPDPPLCDVPWFGHLVVLSSGDVNFCCFSPARVGNVNEQSFDEIWNGATMRRIRRSLAHQEMPAECQTVSCPIYRGDENHFIRARIVGMHSEAFSGQKDAHRAIRAGLAKSSLTVAANADSATMTLQYDGPPVYADLYVAIVREDSPARFLPTMEVTPIPFETGISLQDLAAGRSVGVDLSGRGSGSALLSVALFESGSRPNVLSNCYWAVTVPLAG